MAGGWLAPYRMVRYGGARATTGAGQLRNDLVGGERTT